jgi:triacylglycerol lipase
MHGPEGFDWSRAIQLGGLVDQAYLQYDAFRKGEAWRLPSEYSLEAELKYAGIQPDARGPGTTFEKEFHQLARSKLRGAEEMPIGFIASRKGDVFLIFRGTMTATEWIRDLNIRLTPYPYRSFGSVHDGFIRTYEVFRRDILNGLRARGSGTRLFIAGHSLGAALATLSGPDIESARSFKAITITTFGSPRVGDRVFAAAYNGLFGNRSFRVANSSDIVVAMPFPVPFLGFLGGYFTHVETAVDFTLQEEDVEKNHSMKTYLRAVGAERERKGLLRSLFRPRA